LLGVPPKLSVGWLLSARIVVDQQEILVPNPFFRMAGKPGCGFKQPQRTRPADPGSSRKTDKLCDRGRDCRIAGSWSIEARASD